MAERCLGIVTKIDLIGNANASADAFLNILLNKVHPMGMGRIGIRCRTHTEQQDNVSFKEVRLLGSYPTNKSS